MYRYREFRLELFSPRLERFVKSTQKEQKELKLYDKLSESDRDIVELVYNLHINILPTQYHSDYEDGNTHIHREHILDIDRVKNWIFEKEQKIINKENAKGQLDHVFGTGHNKGYYNKDKWAKRQRNEGAQTYQFNLSGFKTWDDWKRLEKEKKLKEARAKKEEKESQIKNKPKVEIEPTSKDIRESENVFT